MINSKNKTRPKLTRRHVWQRTVFGYKHECNRNEGVPFEIDPIHFFRHVPGNRDD